MSLDLQEFVQSSDCHHLRVTTLGVYTLIQMILLLGKRCFVLHHYNSLQSV